MTYVLDILLIFIGFHMKLKVKGILKSRSTFEISLENSYKGLQYCTIAYFLETAALVPKDIVCLQASAIIP